MKTKKKITPFLIVFAIIFILLYILLAAKPLNKEYQYMPEWKISVSSPSISEVSDSTKKIPFNTGDSIGYFTPDGKVSLYQSYPSKVTISDSYYAFYDTQASGISFYNNKGQLQGILDNDGFPHIEKENIYVFLPGGSSYSKCNNLGKVEWNVENIMPITAFNSNKDYTATGYADGNILIINNKNGEKEFTYAPGGSDYPVILGLDISPDGEYVASISGHNKQRFVLAQKELTQPKIIFHNFTENEYYSPCMVKFTADGKKVLYNFKNKLGIYSIPDKTNKFISIAKQVIQLEESDDLFILLGRAKNKYTVYILDSTCNLTGSFSYSANSSFIKVTEGKLFIGKDNSISCINLLQK